MAKQFCFFFYYPKKIPLAILCLFASYRTNVQSLLSSWLSFDQKFLFFSRNHFSFSFFFFFSLLLSWENVKMIPTSLQFAAREKKKRRKKLAALFRVDWHMFKKRSGMVVVMTTSPAPIFPKNLFPFLLPVKLSKCGRIFCWNEDVQRLVVIQHLKKV